MRLAALFLLIHAAAVVGLAAYAAIAVTGTRAVGSGAVLLTGGAMAFSGDIATLAFAGRHIAPGIAPAGGMVLILGWLIVAAAPWVRRPRV